MPRFGYLWGVSKLKLRDGQNGNLSPGNKEVRVDGLIFGAQGATFRSRDIALRAQGWISIPMTYKSDWVFDPAVLPSATSRAWDSSVRYMSADLSLIYHLDLGTMPYTAGLVVGYRYNNLEENAKPANSPGGSYGQQTHLHIPYLGVHYGNKDFAGTLVKLDILASPISVSKLEADMMLTTGGTQVRGELLMGFWFESLFSWVIPLGQSSAAGIFANYDFFSFSGDANVKASAGSNRFLMDFDTHLFACGITASYGF